MTHQAKKKPVTAVSARPPLLQALEPKIYDSESNAWTSIPDSNDQKCLTKNTTLKIVSWNILFELGTCPRRATAAMDDLENLFESDPGDLIVMLQEVRQESLEALLSHEWVRRNVIASNNEPPTSVHRNGGLYWESEDYYTILLILRRFGKVKFFRVPFFTQMARDTLCVDLPLEDNAGKYLRVCTTHLESLWDDRGYRAGQLAVISQLLKAPGIVAGIVGGDMNAITKYEHDFHNRSNINLRDVWKDHPALVAPSLQPSERDLSFGQAKGNTIGRHD